MRPTTYPLSLFKKNIGIAGGGQLAKFMVQEASNLGVNCFVLSENKLDPAALATAQWLHGSPHELNDLRELARRCQIITFESEFIDLDIVNAALKFSKCKSLPNPKIMKTLRNRFFQKNWLKKYKLPTADFIKWEKDKTKLELFNNGFVFKQCTHGYDGYGTVIFNNKSQFKSTKIKDNQEYIVEEFVAFKRELALTAFRSACGDILFYPLVETFQKNAQCFWVKGPVNNQNIKTLKNKITKAITKSNYVGSITFELFETQNSDLIVNEVAPRVHNSAHHSLTSMSLNQFKAHLLCLLGAKLPKKVKLKMNGFAMVNLIGSGRTKVIPPPHQVGELYWYNKSLNKKFRKMGHISILDSTPESALKKLLNYEKEFKL